MKKLKKLKKLHKAFLLLVLLQSLFSCKTTKGGETTKPASSDRNAIDTDAKTENENKKNKNNNYDKVYNDSFISIPASKEKEEKNE